MPLHNLTQNLSMLTVSLCVKMPMDFSRPPKSPMPQAKSHKKDQRPPDGDKLANSVKNDKIAWNLASRLYRLEGFQKSEVAAYLQKK